MGQNNRTTCISRILQCVFRNPDVRKHMLYTLGLLAVYRIGTVIPLPGINHDFLSILFGGNRTIYTFIGYPTPPLQHLSIYSLGITPYITAFIVMHLAMMMVPFLKRVSKEGIAGRVKITQYIRYMTILFTCLQGFMMAVSLEALSSNGLQIVLNPGWGFRLAAMITLTTGTVFIMWIAEQISEYGIGNGICLIVFADIVAQLPSGISEIWFNLQARDISVFSIVFLIIIIVAAGAAVIVIVVIIISKRKSG